MCMELLFPPRPPTDSQQLLPPCGMLALRVGAPPPHYSPSSTSSHVRELGSVVSSRSVAAWGWGMGMGRGKGQGRVAAGSRRPRRRREHEDRSERKADENRCKICELRYSMFAPEAKHVIPVPQPSTAFPLSSCTCSHAESQTHRVSLSFSLSHTRERV